ncbi:MAG: MBL fold metallo-hydrolase [Promethearchaeota archaeon]
MIEINWISHAGFLIKSGTLNIYTDPYQFPDGLPKASIILISHEHFDHAEEDSIKRVINDETTVICPKTCMKNLKKFKPVGMNPGETKSINDVRITAFPAYTFPGKPFHPKEKKWLGYILEIEGKKLYHAGDCDIMEEMKDLKKEKLDVAMIPVGDKGYTMDFNDAAKAATYIKPKILVPMHDWDQDLEPFKKQVEEENMDIKVEILRGKKLKI